MRSIFVTLPGYIDKYEREKKSIILLFQKVGQIDS